MRLESRVMIHRPIQEVFEFVSEPEQLPLWASGVSRAERTYRGPMGLGATFELLHEGHAHQSCWEVIEHEPPRAVGWRRLDGRFFTQARYTLRSIGRDTGLSLEVYGGVGTSTQPRSLLEREMQQLLAANLSRLRDVLEIGISEETVTGAETAGASRKLPAREDCKRRDSTMR